MTESESVLTAPDGTVLHVHRWTPDGTPKAIVLVVHGAAEHAARYRRLAEVLIAEGYAVAAHDQRGHGRTATDHGTLGVARPGGWNAMIDDLHVVADAVGADHPGVPLVLLGHSMGSAVVQGSLPTWGRELAGVVLSGPAAMVAEPAIVDLLAAAAAGDAADQPSELFAGVFAGFNQHFADTAPDPTAVSGYEWLSRDAAEVQAYVDDPLCGDDVALSNGFVADMIIDGAAAVAPDRQRGIRPDITMLIVAGEDDPVTGGADTVRALGDHYASLLGSVDVRIYPGARHELLNEVNRDEVHADLLTWLSSALGSTAR